MSEMVGGDQPNGVDLSLWLFEKPYTKLYLVHGVRYCTRMLQVEIKKWTASQYAFFWGGTKMSSSPFHL